MEGVAVYNLTWEKKRGRSRRRYSIPCSGVRKFTFKNATEQLIVLAFLQSKLPQPTG